MPVFNPQGGKPITYYERPGSPQETYAGDTFRAKRIFDVPYTQRWAFIRYMLGSAKLTTDGKTIERSIPDQYFVYFQGTDNAYEGTPKSFMIATTLEGIENLGQQKDWIIGQQGSLLNVAFYDMARITIGYESVTYWVKTDAEMNRQTEYNLKRYTTVFRQPSAEFLSLPFGAFKWVELNPNGSVKYDTSVNPPIPAGIRVTGSNGKIVAASEIILVHHKVPGIPKAIKTHIGTVNKYDWPEIGALKGQLLLTNVELKPFKWFEDQRLYDITYKMKFLDPDPEGSKANPNQPRGHNWFLQFFPVDTTTNVANSNIDTLLQGKQEYKLISSDGTPTGKTVYEYMDFKLLFTDYEPSTA